MTNEQILKKAIEKAKENGFIFHLPRYIVYLGDGLMLVKDNPFDEAMHLSYHNIIFSNSFAKAFWGEQGNIDEFDFELGIPEWQCALMEMVLEEDPILYLKQFI